MDERPIAGNVTPVGKMQKPKDASSAAGESQAIVNMANSLKKTRNQIVVEGWADTNDKDKFAASLDRANRVREQLIRNGIAPEQVVAVGKGEQAGKRGCVSIVETTPVAANEKTGEA